MPPTRVQERFGSGPAADSPAVESVSPSATTVLLIRHAHTHAVGSWLAGRLPGVALSPAGVTQAERLGERLAASVELKAIYTSPLERAYETAAAIARHQHAHLEECDELSEIDFGSWTGRTFAELDTDPAWRAFNQTRATAGIPGGEQPGDVQRRIVGAIARLARLHPGQTIAIVSHADVLRFALLHYRSMSLDLYYCFQVEPGSVSVVRLSSDGARVLYVNEGKFAAAAT